MAFIPLSLILEIGLVALGFMLMEYRYVGRIVASGCFMFAIRWVTDTQVYLIESSGTVISYTAAYPTAILGPFVFVLVIFWYMSLVSIFEYLGRDFLGRKPQPPG